MPSTAWPWALSGPLTLQSAFQTSLPLPRSCKPWHTALWWWWRQSLQSILWAFLDSTQDRTWALKTLGPVLPLPCPHMAARLTAQHEREGKPRDWFMGSSSSWTGSCQSKGHKRVGEDKEVDGIIWGSASKTVSPRGHYRLRPVASSYRDVLLSWELVWTFPKQLSHMHL